MSELAAPYSQIGEDLSSTMKLRLGECPVLDSICAVEYRWDLETDDMQIAGDFNGIFQETAPNIHTGSQFSELLTVDSAALFHRIRTEVVESYANASTPITHVYCAYPDGHRQAGRVWFENIGRIFRTENGRPLMATGIVRVLYAKRVGGSSGLAINDMQEHLMGPLGRRMFMDLLSDSLEDAKQTNKPVAVLMATLANLDDINSQYGFDAADEVIEAVILNLRNMMRKRDYIGRISGARIALVLHSCDEKAVQVAFERFSSNIAKTKFVSEGNNIETQLCCGCIIAPQLAATVQNALERAKHALEDAKLPVNKGFAIYTASLERTVSVQKSKEASETLISALNERRIELAYQPVLNGNGAGVWFYEALVRLRDKEGRLVTAGAFVPAAEKLGLMPLIDHRVLEMALLTLDQHPDIMLSINITPSTTSSLEWMATLKSAHQNNPKLLNRLIVELTESAVVDNLEWCKAFLTEVKALGCLAAIDDFGAGYTSFRYLRAFDVDIVKIDGGYIMNLSNSADDQAFVKTLVTLSKSLDLKTVAEWVVNAQDAALLRDWGVDGLQGEFVSMPVSSIQDALHAVLGQGHTPKVVNW